MKSIIRAQILVLGVDVLTLLAWLALATCASQMDITETRKRNMQGWEKRECADLQLQAGTWRYSYRLNY